ncbi:adenosylhomocysteinase [Dactylosporangium matsuzakiense]|uniref:S-adenosyl-L-homocysteine hydrolase n=1 Tax=Dactylosporangium matsuzakiense TaxID=53360 RepID=A0A9W6KDC4_9ACTN|nr:NAD(P)-dependent oxidoreductase [Dactylosporangium matsuzakiense]GLK99177.1 S-adenosyl-L-homocysteine hydrolase [Dactylosporangium matsuzakiense]
MVEGDDVRSRMPVLTELGRRFAAAPPLARRRVAAALNITAEAVELVRVLLAGGAQVLVVSSKATTFDPAAAEAMTTAGARVLTEPAPGNDAVGKEILAFAPELLLDNGDLTALVTAEDGPTAVLGGTVHSQHALSRVRRGAPVPYPLLAVTESALKTAVETAHGTGQAAARGLMNAGVQLAGSRVLLLGFGVTGRAVADYLRGCHARVMVSEVAPVPLLQAVYLGFEAVPLRAGLAAADVVVSVTDARQALALADLRLLRDGAVVGGIGHTRTEIDRAGLRAAATTVARVPGGVRYDLGDRRLTVLEGPGGNHVFAGINPPELMDISFALHALSLTTLATGRRLPPGVGPVPADVDAEVARLKLDVLGLSEVLP